LHASERPILVLGGTAEARGLAQMLVEQGYRVISSLAGRTSDPIRIAGETRVGGFGGQQGLVDYIRSNGTAILIDATHPFATQISDNAIAAAEATGIPFARLERPAWLPRPGDIWTSVADGSAAARAIPSKARVLLALGRQHLAPFSRRNDVHFIVRMIDPPDAPLDLMDFELELSKPGNFDDEVALLSKKRISHIVCRNSGGSQSYAKLRAAREQSIPVIMIERPQRPAIATLPDIGAILSFVAEAMPQPGLKL
jgi:precorrin-6A/cobalt-precorrin-6A reductase